ncbi:MAG: phenylalanine--tRNA ligase subunit beta [Bdellovibrionales bacterium]|nr:phenylalanine--tRNA ligase subunit beta [Bdellovibrionales bacterium]
MRIPISWLNEFLSTTPKAEELAEALTMHGIEVSDIERQDEGIKDVWVAEIVEFSKHPNADRLSLCKVTDGEQTFDIVCGAKNFQNGDHVALAKIGAVLPNGLKIEKSKIRGVASFGMLCSKEELGLEHSSEGIWILPKESPVGQNLAKYLKKEDSVLVLELTPNRGDCLSIIGVAQEVAAIFELPTKIPSSGAKAIPRGALNVSVKDPEGCPRYTIQHFDSIEVSESPTMITQRLTAVGIRPILNVVDFTNYVMIERGQPQHAFDAEKVVGAIEVRRANEHETLLCLDDVERELTPEDLIIADQQGPIGIAGVIGGKRTAVSTDTKAIYLESAHFSPSLVRRTAKRLNIHTESSHRFERFVDPSAAWSASSRTRELLEEYAQARSIAEYDADKGSFKSNKIRLRKGTIVRYLGQDIKNAGDYLTRLGFSLEKMEEDYSVDVPFRRPDVTREVDLVEEIARLHGYNNFSAIVPSLVSVPQKHTQFESIGGIKKFFSSIGFHETRSYSFVSKQWNASFGKGGKPIKIVNGITSEMDEMRMSLVPHLIDSWKINRSRQVKGIKLFEAAPTYVQNELSIADQMPCFERQCVTMLVAGSTLSTWNQQSRQLDYYDIKGAIEAFSAKYNLRLSFKVGDEVPAYYHPGIALTVNYKNQIVGYLGGLHPELLKQFDLSNVFVGELDVTDLRPELNVINLFKPYSSFPTSERDVAFVVDQKVFAANIVEEIRKMKIAILQEVRVFDVYQGKGFTSGKKSLAFSVIFGSLEKTLTDQDINRAMDDIIKKISKTFDAQLRS